MHATSVQELSDHLQGVVRLEGNNVIILDEARLPEKMNRLAYSAVFGDGLVRDTARWLLWAIGQAVGVYPASIHELYMAVGRGDVPANFTVPAMNIRAMNYNTSRAAFRAAREHNVGAMIFEIARSEMSYTDQRPAEYVASLMAAALKEGFRGPLFIQGDHIQVSAKGYATDQDKELNALRDLIREAIEAGFYNIDIDTSTLVALDQPDLDAQQRTNYSLCAALTRTIREIEPEGITVSVGGEIGEVGGHNSTVPELRAFMEGYLHEIGDAPGISKISVQTGTSHGGVVLSDGSLADVKVDFDTLRELSRVAREDFGLGGAVQHGASTLPANAFHKFPQVGTLEIHLATNFQTIIYDHLPQELVEQAYDYCRAELRNEWKAGETEEQFLYSTRKKALGAFKQQWWNLDDAIQSRLRDALQAQFAFLFEELNVKDTADLAREVTTRVTQPRRRPTEAAAEREIEVAADLAD